MELELLSEDVHKAIGLDSGCEILYDYKEKALVNYPLIDTKFLNKLMDEYRKKIGFAPMFNGKDEECNLFGWYDYDIWADESLETKIQDHIRVVVCESVDDGKEYYIKLNKETQIAVYRKLNEELYYYTGCNCEQHFKWAREDYLFNEK